MGLVVKDVFHADDGAKVSPAAKRSSVILASAPAAGEDGEGEGLGEFFERAGAGDHCSRRIKRRWQCRGRWIGVLP